jgi:hypothetical protein
VVGSLESGSVSDPRVSTLQRLLAAAGCSLAVIDGGGAALIPSDDGPRDRAGRRFPGHVDVRPVRDPHDWWGWLRYSSWAYPPLPMHTFDLSRTKRTSARARAAGMGVLRPGRTGGKHGRGRSRTPQPQRRQQAAERPGGCP